MGIGPAVAIPAAVSGVGWYCCVCKRRGQLQLAWGLHSGRDDTPLITAGCHLLLLQPTAPYAAPSLWQVEMAGLSLDDIDVYEINEAFASQVHHPFLYSTWLL